jgi:hypothetical protein
MLLGGTRPFCMVCRMRAQQSQMSLHRLQQAVVLSRSTSTAFKGFSATHSPSLACTTGVSGRPQRAWYLLPDDDRASSTATRATCCASLGSAAFASASLMISSAVVSGPFFLELRLPWNINCFLDQLKSSPDCKPTATLAAGKSMANCRAPLYFARATTCDFSILPVKSLGSSGLDRDLNFEIMYSTDCSSGVSAWAGWKGARHAAQQPKRYPRSEPDMRARDGKRKTI